ncbi:hypothetical protein JTE90_024079 [Oedothorax gibbosus]|uniref:Major facilitator superfamily (MFS) profile domain-containing protein n=1 Tax=Oedothorax gibbosus TaxID=931172 RepID=A0AAV6TZD1_9ARAC|nr:hypothetical protein JTE90_024079 [Oedothorax gibbosus]
MSLRSSVVGYRHLVAIILFSICFVINVQRLSTAIVIVAMVNHTYKEPFAAINSSKVCMSVNGSTDNVEELKVEGKFHWSPKTQGYIFGIYFIGRTSAFLPSAKLGRLYEYRRIALCACIVASLATLLAPLAARWHVYAFMVVQLLRGVGAAVMNTSVFALMGHWFSKLERGLLTTFVLTGYSMGAIFATIVSGWICDHPSMGWPVAFYMPGCLGILTSIIMAATLYEMPINCPRLVEAEKKYFASNQEQIAMAKNVSPPWKKILTSVPIHALILGIFGQYWMQTYFWSVQSTFLGTVQQFSIIKNGVASALPYLLKAIGEYSAMAISHWLLTKNVVGVNTLRKSCNTIGCAGITAAILGLYFGGCDDYVIVGASLASMFFLGVTVPGALISFYDMAPRFAGSLAGLLNGVSSLPTIVMPIAVGYLTKNQTLEEWQVVFLISIGVVVSCALIFAVFGSAKLQPWNSVDEDASITIDLSKSKVRVNENTRQNSSM